MVSNGSIMSTPDIKGKLEKLKARGGKLVVIDPRKTRTAELANQHLFIKPGSDILMLLAFLHVLFKENLVRKNHVFDFIDNIDEVENIVSAYSPESIELKTGIDAEDIYNLVREFTAAKSAICYGRLGVSVQQYGSLCHWLINLINILTGNLDTAGGVMFSTPAIDFIALLKREAKAFRWTSRVKGLPEVASDFPTSTLADEILTPGTGQVKAMITLAGNPIISAPNQDRMETAFSSLDFMVAIDIYLNETTRHADIILPPATALEVMHYDFVLNIVSTRNVANYSPPVFKIDSKQRYDWQILFELQKRLDTAPAVLKTIKHKIFAYLTPEKRIDLGLKVGPFGWRNKQKLSLKKLKASPHGIDLGALTQVLPKRLFTANKRIDLFPARIKAAFFEFDQNNSFGEDEYLLIGRRHLRSNNSWLHNSPRLMKGPARCTLHINPQDALKLEIAEGEEVELSTETGSVLVPAEITDTIMAGVLSVPHGWGHSKKGIALKVASAKPGVNINTLISDLLIDKPTGNAVFNGVPVKIKKVDNTEFKLNLNQSE
ncbi:MAG: anaerobic selenocysteine-containing dehydrogenase [Limisphaerales bacterium]